MKRLIALLFPPKPLPEPEARCKTYTRAELAVLFQNHDTARRISEAHH